MAVITPNWRERIVGTPGTLGGKARIKGTRISVAFVLEHMSHGMTAAELLEDHPHLTIEDICACLDYALTLVQDGFLLTGVDVPVPVS